MRPLNKILTSLTCLFFLLSIATAQKVSYDVRHFGTNDGLPDHRIWSILEHSSGFVFVGTARGLSRFDGYTFKSVKTDDDEKLLETQSIGALHELDDQQIAIAISYPSSRDGGERFLVYDYQKNRASEITIETYNTVIQNARKAGAFANESESSATDRSYSDHHGNKFVATVDGSKPLTASLILSTGEILDLTPAWKTLVQVTSPKGRNLGNVMYWTGHNGLIMITARRSPFDLILNEEVEDWEYRTICRSMIDLNEDSILISSETRGLVIYNRKTSNVTTPIFQGPFNATIHRLYFREFFASSDNGDTYGVHWGNVIKMNFKEAIAENWVGDGKRAFASSRIGESSIVVSHIQTIKPGSSTEFCQIDLIDIKAKSIKTLVFKSGQDLVDNARGTYMLRDSDSTVWYGTKSGLFLLDIKNEEIKHLYLNREAEVRPYPFPISYNLSGPHIWVLHKSEDGKLWIGLDGDGLNVLDITSDEVEYISYKEGLPNNTVVGILPDSTGYWLGTFRGLAHYNTKSKQFRNFYTSNGIAHNEFNRFSFIIDRYGKYYFGSMNGVTSFYPKDVLSQTENLELLVSDIAFYDKKTKQQVVHRGIIVNQKEITIPSTNRTLLVNMTLNDLNNAEGNTFFYKLEEDQLIGNNQTLPWIALGMNHELRFENLESGRYILRLKGVSSVGVPSEEVAILLRVEAFFYTTWWFISLSIVIVFGVLYLFYRYRLNQAIEVERLRTRLSSDLHDDVGGLLSGVAFQMELLGKSVADEHKPLVRRVADASRTAMVRMRDVIWAIDARNSSFHDLFERMQEHANDVLHPLGIGYDFKASHINLNNDVPAETRHSLILIFKEFITNSIKHSNATQITVSMVRSSPGYTFAMRDNGTGNNDEVGTYTGQGLENMKMRVAKLDGSIEFTNDKGFGVHIGIPGK